MANRILVLVRARLAGEWLGERAANAPVAPLLFHASLSGFLCGLVRSELDPFAYGVFALCVSLALTALPLLGELAPLLRADPAAEWIGAQPVRPVELRAASVLTLAVMLGTLSLGSLVAAALFAPAELSLAGRALLVAAGIVQSLFAAALLLGIQALLGPRAEGMLVLVQTALFCAVIVGGAAGLRLLPELRAWAAATDRAFLPLPPAWFASVLLPHPWRDGGPLFLAAVLASAATVLTLVAAPFPSASRARATRSPLGILLEPFHRLAVRLWVRRDERASFELVYEALPAERDFVIRTYPLVAVPIAFLLLGARGGGPDEGLLAILLFAPATYLPILLVHVPATATPDARWLIDTAPLDPRAEREGALKAVAVRFLLPLWLALAGACWLLGGAALALRLSLPAAVVTALVLRAIWPLCVERPPLSTAPGDLGTAWADRLTSLLLALAAATTVLAIAIWKWVQSPWLGLAIAAVAVAVELARSQWPRAERAQGHARSAR